MHKQHHPTDTDTDFAGYASWIEEAGLFFFVLAACGTLIWLGWSIGQRAGLWS